SRPGPNWNEMIPLVSMLSNGLLERTHDLLGEVDASGPIPQSSAIIFQRCKDVGVIFFRSAGQKNWQDDAAGSPRQFGHCDGSEEGTAKEINRDCGRFRRPVDQQCDVRAGFEASNDFEESERVVANDQRLDVPTSAGLLPELCEAIARFAQGHNLKG